MGLNPLKAISELVGNRNPAPSQVRLYGILIHTNQPLVPEHRVGGPLPDSLRPHPEPK